MPNKIELREIDYIRWQNRALQFYLAARSSHATKLWAPAAYSSAMAIELILKATLIYWDKSFDPLASGHRISKMLRTVGNKAKLVSAPRVPDYFFVGSRYLSVSRYPNEKRGIGIPGTFLIDLDQAFTDLLLLVPFQFNSELKRMLSGKDRSGLLILRKVNSQMRRLRSELSGPN